MSLERGVPDGNYFLEISLIQGLGFRVHGALNLFRGSQLQLSVPPAVVKSSRC